MADTQRGGLAEKDIEQAIAALKKGAHLLKYGRRGKPKFCPFRLSNDESILIWYSGKEEKQLKLSHVSRIIPGQRTAIFRRYPRPEKEYQSFSLICNDRSLDLICKDKEEAEVWFVGLKALITRGNYQKWRGESRCDSASSDSHHSRIRRNSPSITPFDPGDNEGIPLENLPLTRLGKAFCDIISYTAATKESVSNSTLSSAAVENSNAQSLVAVEASRVSLSSAVSSSSHGSGHDDFGALGDVFIWGEGIGNGMLGGGMHRVQSSHSFMIDALVPKALDSKVPLDVHNIACGGRHAILVTRQGEIFSWGEESGGRLGHGVEADFSHPKLIDTLSGMNVESVACGEYHTCAVTFSGDLYTWGDGTHNSGLLGHGSEASHWIPKKVGGFMEGIHVSNVSCGPWHTAIVTSAGQLFTFGDGSFGALGHGDHSSTSIPQEVETLKGQRTMRVACGVWHTAAVVDVKNESSVSGPSGHSSWGMLFTWGDGDKGRLGHGDIEPRLLPECVAALVNENIHQVACGHNLTVVLTTSGQVYTMGSTAYGQLGRPVSEGKVPGRVGGKIADSSIDEISCGSYHVAVLTSKAEVYTWGKGSNGQLGHGDYDHRNTPTLVNFLKDKQVKNVVCGSNFTAVVCLHEWVSSADHSVCSGCHNPFGFRRKRHNCYNCGLVFCKACSSRKSLKASLAPNMNKPYRVCDVCYAKLKKAMEFGPILRIPKAKSASIHHKLNDMADKESRGLNLRTTLSRMSSFGSGTQSESKHSKPDMKVELHNSRVFPSLSENFQFGGFFSSKVSHSLFRNPKKVSSVSLPGSRMPSQSTSPVSEKSSPARFSEEIFDYTKNRNDGLSQEIINLRVQVEDLTSKTQHLEAELEKTTQQLKEVTAIAIDEAEKHKSAKEAIKSLTAQLKEMAERPPEEFMTKFSAGSIAGNTSNVLNQLSNMNHPPNRITSEAGSNENLTNRTLHNGTKPPSGNGEWVVPGDPGVYITLSSLPGGGTELKRVRFSRKHFTQEQAAKWWSEKGAKVCEELNARNSEQNVVGSRAFPGKKHASYHGFP
ncbi:hypothetical protein F2P56_030084 [Juglans regia]|uniref:PH, RCC1 and FYVE domains-containing protein 1-like n=2 Tax=Juglans regia TaxID=51240 RepID=A0A2I4EE54_JUGRE|nr:PH, RCC1 and FYVE domains-containing protein 1-like [Juglans regia]KAF5449663.1 hypothetical protein F2P56_030084 [Juglans regia]